MEHVFKIEGQQFERASAPGALLRDLLDVVVETTRRVVRLQVEGRSTAPSRDPAWLVEAADFEIQGFREGSSEVVCEAATLAEAAPEEFGQRDFFFSSIDVDATGLHLFEQTLDAVDRGDDDSELLDDKVLDKLTEFDRVFRHGVESVGFGDGRGPVVRPEDVATYETMKRGIPEPREVKVAGRLDLVKVSAEAFELRLENGDRVRGTFDADEQFDTFKSLLDQEVLVSGRATFKPSGTLRKLEARAIRPATEADALWTDTPEAHDQPLEIGKEPPSDTDDTGLEAIVGEWPGDESDDEIRQALRELS
jgi:hypothetical protein